MDISSGPLRIPFSKETPEITLTLGSRSIEESRAPGDTLYENPFFPAKSTCTLMQSA